MISDDSINRALAIDGWDLSADQGRLMLFELLCKAGAGYYNSHTEEGFLRYFIILKKDRSPNKRGRVFMCDMAYKHSNKKPVIYDLIEKYRN